MVLCVFSFFSISLPSGWKTWSDIQVERQPLLASMQSQLSAIDASCQFQFSNKSLCLQSTCMSLWLITWEQEWFLGGILLLYLTELHCHFFQCNCDCWAVFIQSATFMKHLSRAQIERVIWWWAHETASSFHWDRISSFIDKQSKVYETQLWLYSRVQINIFRYRKVWCR